MARKNRQDTLQYRGYTARFTEMPLINKGFYFCQAWVCRPDQQQRGEAIGGRGITPSEARKDCETRVKAKIDGWSTKLNTN